ncbi:hypothetical protein EYF80_062186 [Liparis tanakae]|uniref:Uncharacterized protein n=1 Tax=Liparis tanakae TaxID=230148 RepID=A0A4Z2EFG1_9TELE|nr:hypothetical protein EYF80_062186 [Liparis tanakae]
MLSTRPASHRQVTEGSCSRRWSASRRRSTSSESTSVSWGTNGEESGGILGAGEGHLKLPPGSRPEGRGHRLQGEVTCQHGATTAWSHDGVEPRLGVEPRRRRATAAWSHDGVEPRRRGATTRRCYAGRVVGRVHGQEVVRPGLNFNHLLDHTDTGGQGERTSANQEEASEPETQRRVQPGQVPDVNPHLEEGVEDVLPHAVLQAGGQHVGGEQAPPLGDTGDSQRHTCRPPGSRGASAHRLPHLDHPLLQGNVPLEVGMSSSEPEELVGERDLLENNHRSTGERDRLWL